MNKLPPFVIGAGIGAFCGAILGTVVAGFIPDVGLREGFFGGLAVGGIGGMVLVLRFGKG